MKHLFFSTPVWASKIEGYENINLDLKNYIADLRNNDPVGINKSNSKGWHSQNFNLKDRAVSAFINLISNNINMAINDMGWDLNIQTVKIPNMWSIINKKDSFNQRHHHGNSTLSAAYYVSAPENCGDIVFYDPRPAPIYYHPIAKNPNKLNAMVNSITPSEGLLVLFPSYLDHSVNPSKSDAERIVISFNVSIISK